MKFLEGEPPEQVIFPEDKSSGVVVAWSERWRAHPFGPILVGWMDLPRRQFMRVR
jgi:hypothetical protein